MLKTCSLIGKKNNFILGNEHSVSSVVFAAHHFYCPPDSFSLQVKVAILKYIETLAQQMDPGDFVNSSETRLAVSRIITWTTEPKSSDVRKVCLLTCP